MERRHSASRFAQTTTAACALAACLGTLPAGAAAAQSPAAATPVPASGSAERIVLPDDVVPRRYDIELRPDAPHLAFRGSVRVRIDVTRPTSTVTLNAVDLTFDRVWLDGKREAPKIARDAGRREVALRFGAVLPAGEHTLSIDYHGRISRPQAGLFAVDYETPHGKRRALYTQFESGDARRLVPCWDQPDRKAVFALSAVVPSELTAVSNMPIEHTTAVSARIKRVDFAPSPRMSSYLLFFALGDFERAHRRAGGVDVGVIVQRGEHGSVDFALDAMAQILPYYNDYFGARYPLAKLDLIAAPVGHSFGAMENWGAILFAESMLLVDPRVSTESDRQDVYETIAHEVAHQWFGDLVTMAWWDDLWLNEGFATWMSHKVMDRFHPEWEVWLRNEPVVRATMTGDAGAGTHPIVAPIRDAVQADAAFDSITYDKGAAVIRMIETYVGEGVFRDGVRAYMARYARSNTVSDDLWRELETVSSVPVAGIAHDFTLQAGVPMIGVTQTDGSVTLSQDRFGIDPSSQSASSWPQSWHVPVVAEAPGPEMRHLIVSAQQPVTVLAPGALLVNAGQTGYFVSRYAPEPLHRLLDRLSQLSPLDQLGLFGDTSALSRAGYSPMSSLLELVAALPADADAAVWSAVCDGLIALGRRYDEGTGARAYRGWVRRELAPVFARAGWDPQAGESSSETTLRATLLRALAEADDEAVIAEARRRFDRFATAPDTLAGDMRNTVVAIVAMHADAAAWERLRAMARAAQSTLEQEQMYKALGGTRDPELAQRALRLVLAGEAPPVAAQGIVEAVAVRHAAATFDFVSSHWDRIAPLVVPGFLSAFAPKIAAGSDDPGTAARLSEFSRRVGPACDPGEVRKAIANIHYLSSIKQQRLVEVDRWLGDHSS
jgi:aminopeptidase N